MGSVVSDGKTQELSLVDPIINRFTALSLFTHSAAKHSKTMTGTASTLSGRGYG